MARRMWLIRPAGAAEATPSTGDEGRPAGGGRATRLPPSYDDGVMAHRRFRVASLQPDRIRVEGREADHALKVLRLRVGDRIVLFDGGGAEADGRIQQVAGDALTVEVVARRNRPAGPQARLALAVAMPKGTRADWLVEKCAELGVGLLQPILCARSVVHSGKGKVDRWRRKSTEAAKQSGQARVMTIQSPAALSDLLPLVSGRSHLFFGDVGAGAASLLDALRAVGSTEQVMQPPPEAPEARDGSAIQRDPPPEAHGDSTRREAPFALWILIGPEGGWTDEERVAISRAGGRAVRLGETVLRVETATVAAAAIWACVGATAFSSAASGLDDFLKACAVMKTPD